jgi:cellulose synthase/poly-beta-1,6-N-acetylglucosamine synthase-like glycosyltransferase
LIFWFLSKSYRLKVGFFFSFFFLGLKSILYIALFFNFVGFFFCYVENKPSGGEIPLERERKRRNSLCAKPWVQGNCGKVSRSSAANLCRVSGALLHC